MEQPHGLRDGHLRAWIEEVPDVHHRWLADGGKDDIVHPGVGQDHRPLAHGELHEELRRAGLFPELSEQVYQPRREDPVAVLLGELQLWLEWREIGVQSARRTIRFVSARGEAAAGKERVNVGLL